MPKTRDIPVEWSKNLTIYEVNLRQFTDSGSIKEFEGHLPRLKELGVGILWFMPLHPIGEVNRKGELGSYYSVKDYFSVDPIYGTLNEFRRLVAKIHNLGMFVIIDWVANHTSCDNSLTVTNPEFYTLDEEGRFRSPIPEWGDVLDLDYNRPEVHRFMIDAMKYWLTETDIDGFRCDMAKLIPLEFWQSARLELEKVKPVFMLAEADNHEMLNGAFDSVYNWNIYHTMNSIARGESSVWNLNSMLNNEIFGFPANGYQMLFNSNHDENAWNGSELERLHFGLEAFTVLYFTLTGIPLIYNGQEAGNQKRLKFFEKDQIEWKVDKMFALYQSLISLKKRNRALWSGPYGGVFRRIETKNGGNVMAYMRELAGNKVVVVLNLSGQEQFAHLSVDNLPGYYNDFFTGKQVELYDNFYLSLEPWAYRIFEFYAG
jgi:1,4-alpha-glucan branching enzyme